MSDLDRSAQDIVEGRDPHATWRAFRERHPSVLAIPREPVEDPSEELPSSENTA